MLYVLLIAALVAGAGIWVYAGSGRAIVRARHDYRSQVAGRVLARAAELGGHQLWVALPFAQLQMDPTAYPESWDAYPRRWLRVVGSDGSGLVLEGEGRIEALGCEWYVYADEDGKAIDFSVSGSIEDGAPLLPPGIDPESVAPSDVEFGGRGGS